MRTIIIHYLFEFTVGGRLHRVEFQIQTGYIPLIIFYLVAESESSYNYTVRIDRVDASLLCVPNDNSIFLGSLVWGIVDGVILRNPINMYAVSIG